MTPTSASFTGTDTVTLITLRPGGDVENETTLAPQPYQNADLSIVYPRPYVDLL